MNVCCLCWFYCSDSLGDVGGARHSKKSCKMLSSLAGGELNEGILASLGQLLTSNANSLGELLKLMPSVSRLSQSVTATSDSRAVKRRRVSYKPATALSGMLAMSEGESSAAATIGNMTETDRQSSHSACFTGL